MYMLPSLREGVVFLQRINELFHLSISNDNVPRELDKALKTEYSAPIKVQERTCHSTDAMDADLAVER